MTATEGLTHRLRPYPSYKDSSVEWIGEIPEEWNAFRLKEITSINQSTLREETPSDLMINYIEISDVNGRQEASPTSMPFGEAPSRARRITRQGDVIISTVRTYLKAVQYINAELAGSVVSTGFAVLTPQDSVYPGFLKYAVLGNGFLDEVILRSRGVSYPAIEASQLGNIPIPLPTLNEQQAIAAFLNRETARIDELMREQEALLDDLSDKRQATINAAVTGQEISGPRQELDSIGSLPAHWEVVKLKKLAEVRSGVTKGRDLHGRQLVDVHYLRVANVQDGYLKLDDVATIPMPVEELERYSLKPGDVLMNEGGDNDKLGRGAVWRGEVTPCVHQNHVFSVRPHEVESDWLALINTSSYAKFFFFINSKQSTNLASISSSTIKELPVVLPPTTERRQLLDHVAQQLAQIDELREEVRANIEDMRIHRSALITAAVTGKIDVREAE